MKVKLNYLAFERLSCSMPEKRMLGTGRMNLTGGAATITMPVEAVELWDVDETGKDVVWFTDETKIYAARREDVSVDD